MKQVFRLFFLAALVTVAFTVKAQNIDGVVNGLKSGNADKVAGNISNNVLLTVLEKSNNYSKAQAVQIIKDFFSKNSVKNFTLKHKGDSPNGKFAIGTLTTSGGNYRVNIFMKQDGGKEVIRELRFQLIE